MRRLRGYIDASKRTCIEMFDNDEKEFERVYENLRSEKNDISNILERHLRKDPEIPFSFCVSRLQTVLMLTSYESQLRDTEMEIDHAFSF